MDTKDNPFMIAFGPKPKQYIPRSQTDEIIGSFNNDFASLCFITGIRASGKTTTMLVVKEELRKNDNWIVISLNVNSDDILLSLASMLYEEPLFKPLISKLKIDLSVLGIGVSIEKSKKYSDVISAITQLLKIAKKLNKRILVTIDDVVNNKAMREFCSAFTIFVGDEYPIFLLMTGLYENIFELQNEDSLTFLYRAPRIEMDSLNIGEMADSYKSVFNIDDKRALSMAKKTKGYSYAFQVLGYMTWLYFEKDEEYIEKKTSDYLGEYSYMKIWYELSEKDKEVLYVMANNDLNIVKDIRNIMKLEPNAFSVYRDRLIRKGIIKSEGYGRIDFVLPYFKDFILTKYEN